MTDVHNQLKEVSKFLSDYSTCLMAVGVQTSRIVRNASRIAQTFGLSVEMTVFLKTIILTVWDSEGNHSYSTVGQVKPKGLNFEMNARLSQLSWECRDKRLSLSELEARYNEIISKPRVSKWVVLVLVSFANAAFCRLFQGDYISMAIVFFATLDGFCIRQLLTERGWNHYAVFIISAFVASIIGSTGYVFGWGKTPDMAIGTSVLYLVPGVPLINGIMDIIDGHVLAGTSRLINAALLIICIAMGLSATIFIIGIDTL
jgi:uncharacterized membrane protein YjjP (DUF1212 family)